MSKAIPNCDKSFNVFLKEPNGQSLFLLPTDEVELLGLINFLKKGKSPGCDNISNELKRNSGPEFNKC